MSQVNKLNYFKFFIAALLFGVLFYFSADIGSFLGLDDIFDIFIKILIIIGIGFYAYKREELNAIFNINIEPIYLLVVFIPAIFSFIFQLCPLDFEPFPNFVIVTVIGTVTTAIWEEMFFRYVGCSLFRDEEGNIKWYNVVFLAFAFSMGHVFNGFDNIESLATQLVFTFGLGIFTVALYIHSRSLVLPIIAHFAVNSVSDYFHLFATDEARELAYSGDWFYLLFAIQVLVMICLGFYILKKNNHLA